MGRILKSYLFWTYPRGSFHYDVMVTAILAFIFLSPLVFNYHDQPASRTMTAAEVLVKANGPNGFVYQLAADQVKTPGDGTPLETALRTAIEPISGGVIIDRYEALKDSNGKTTAYKVWAHR